MSYLFCSTLLAYFKESPQKSKWTFVIAREKNVNVTRIND